MHRTRLTRTWTVHASSHGADTTPTISLSLSVSLARSPGASLKRIRTAHNRSLFQLQSSILDSPYELATSWQVAVNWPLFMHIRDSAVVQHRLFISPVANKASSLTVCWVDIARLPYHTTIMGSICSTTSVPLPLNENMQIKIQLGA